MRIYSYARRSRSAFTLVEVILAILIILGIMGVLLFFYQRASELRHAALQEAEFASVSRMFLEQMTSELRTARVVQEQMTGLEGMSNSISYVCTGLPLFSRWITSSNDPVIVAPATDLKFVRYSLNGGTNSTDVLGINRSEQYLLGGSAALVDTNSEAMTTNSTSFTESTQATNDFALTNTVLKLSPMLTDKIRFLRFRYWDGTEWVESWSGMELPAGVEVTVGRESMPTNDAGSEAYPFEVFQRVIYLPNSAHPGNAVSNELAGAEEFFQ